MVEFLVFGVIVIATCGYGVFQYRLYYETPHDEGDAVVYVERGCRVHSSTWRGLHYDTLVITENELILNDVLTFYKGYMLSKSFTHCIKRKTITGISIGTFKFTAISLAGNLKISFTDLNGSDQEYWIKTQDPRFIEHILATAN